MTTRLSLFNSPLLLGFDHFERTLDRVSKTSADGYPPYNIEQVGADQLRITVAVAGFTSQDLSVQIENNQLVIRGRQTEDEKVPAQFRTGRGDRGNRSLDRQWIASHRSEAAPGGDPGQDGGDQIRRQGAVWQDAGSEPGPKGLIETFNRARGRIKGPDTRRP
jgi:hypothetical protein